MRAAAAEVPAAWPLNATLEDVEQIKQDDDRDGNSDQPQKYSAHVLVSVYGGDMPLQRAKVRGSSGGYLRGDGAAAGRLELERRS